MPLAGRWNAGMSLFGALLALAVFAVLVAGGMEWLEERAEERLQRLAGAQAVALSEGVAVWVESNFEARLASAPQEVTLGTLRTAGVLAPGFAANGRDALGRAYRVLMRRVPGDALDVLVTQRVGAGDDLLPVNAVFGAGGQVRIGIVDPDATPAVLRGPAIRADMSGFRGDFPGAPQVRAIGVLQRFDRESVYGDFLYRRTISGLPGANTMETALDMGGNDVTGARNIEADELVLERDLEVGGSLRVTAGLLVRGTAQVNGIATVSGQLRADSASVVGAFSADTGTITNEMRADRVVATGEVRGGSIGTGGALSAGSGRITGLVVAASVAASRATVANDVVAASARVGSLTAGTARVTGNTNVTGSVTAGSVRATSSVTAASAGFSTLVVGNCIGC